MILIFLNYLQIYTYNILQILSNEYEKRVN
jgi:hypothetical protein